METGHRFRFLQDMVQRKSHLPSPLRGRFITGNSPPKDDLRRAWVNERGQDGQLVEQQGQR